MIYIKHRQNRIDQLKKLDITYGTEIDVRSYAKQIVLSHESFKENVKFEKWLKYYNHKFLIINVKEEGIEKKLISILKKNKIKNYFLLDVTIPMIIKLNKVNFFNIAIRISEYENLSNINKFNIMNKWVWIDTFNNKIPISLRNIINLKRKSYKLCLVSPELIYKRKKSIDKIILKNIKLINKFDAICTKFPSYWEKLIK